VTSKDVSEYRVKRKRPEGSPRLRWEQQFRKDATQKKGRKEGRKSAGGNKR
jgi:hypothetical protein